MKKIMLAILLICNFCSIANAAEKHWIQSKTDDGSVLILEDGSTWEVDSVDQIDTNLWLPMTDVIVTDDEDQMISLDDHETVGVTRIE